MSIRAFRPSSVPKVQKTKHRCEGCGAPCLTLYCDGCAPSPRSHMDMTEFDGKNWASQRWNGRPMDSPLLGLAESLVGRR